MHHTCTRTFTFDAAHRVLRHESKCKYLHGHTYKAEVTAEPKYLSELDDLGRVVDFSVLKTVIGQWIDDCWDHGLILNGADPLAELARIAQSEDEKNTVFPAAIEMFPLGSRVFILPSGENPTAENLAKVLCQTANILLLNRAIRDIEIVHVRLWETPNCFADYKLHSHR